MNKLNLSPDEIQEYEQLQKRIKELEHKSTSLTREQLKEKFARTMKFQPRPKGMQIKKWIALRQEQSIPVHGRMKYGEWKFSRKFRVTIKRKKNIEVHPINYKFEIVKDLESTWFTSPRAVYEHLDSFSDKELIGLRIKVYPILDNKNMLDGFGDNMVTSFSYVQFLYGFR